VNAVEDLERHFPAIARAQAAYVRAIDDDRLEAWPDFFLECCRYTITTDENHRAGLEAGIVYADSRAMLVDRVSALRQANIYERHRYRHILGQPWLLEGEGEDDGVRSETPFLVARIMRSGATELFASGRYLDVWRIEASGPRLAERIVVCDSSRIDTLLALPL
jgi:anthranilate 1,2-dioxygenase small subunit